MKWTPAGGGSSAGTLKAALERSERDAVERVLEQTGGNVTEAATMLGVVRTSLYRIMKRHGIAVRNRTAN